MPKKQVSLTIEEKLIDRIRKLPGTSLSSKMEQLLRDALAIHEGKSKSSAAGDVSQLIADLKREWKQDIASLQEAIDDMAAEIQDLNDLKKEECPDFTDFDTTEVVGRIKKLEDKVFSDGK